MITGHVAIIEYVKEKSMIQAVEKENNATHFGRQLLVTELRSSCSWDLQKGDAPPAPHRVYAPYGNSRRFSIDSDSDTEMEDSDEDINASR